MNGYPKKKTQAKILSNYIHIQQNKHINVSLSVITNHLNVFAHIFTIHVEELYTISNKCKSI